jgi:hypothetical protein
MAFQPALIWKVVAEIALEQNDAGRFQITQKGAVEIMQNRGRPETDEKMIADGVD